MTVAVALAVLERQGQWLLQLRDDVAGIVAPGCWGLFGGHLDPGEDAEAALRRELLEEIGYRAAEVTMRYSSTSADRIRHVFSVSLSQPIEALTLHEGQDMALVNLADLQRGQIWSSKLQQIRPLAPALQKAMARLCRPLPHTGALSAVLEGLAFLRDPGFANRRFAQFGPVFETRLLGQPLVFIRGEQAIGDLLAAGEAIEGWWPASVRQLLGSRSLANRNGPDHKARRRVVGQLFSAAALRRNSPGIVEQVNGLAAELNAAAGPVALATGMRRFAFGVIATVVLGLDGSQRDALFEDFEIWTRALFSLPLAIAGSPFARALQARQRLLQRLHAVLQQAQHRSVHGEALIGGLDLLAGGLDEAGLPLDDGDVIEQLLLLLFADYETTASSLSCLMRELLQRPDVLAWLKPELQQLSWPPTAEQAPQAYDATAAPRLDAVVREVMRLAPPVGGFFRRTRRDLLLDGVLVPAGRVVQVAVAASNRHAPASTATDLDVFRPERHLDGSAGPLLLPFGGGERVCLGKALAELEIRLMAVGLLRQTRLQLEADQDLTLSAIPSPTPRSGLLVRAQPLC
ncbi:MAG: cytochrome P450 [Cyanobacteria bacterium K_DeepCast_35m_m2_023]|nr:cytochrome P450 [Cyanobacteria bacterium K_DeepCast_35m_m2_023]